MRSKDWNQILSENANNFDEAYDTTSTANVIYEGKAAFGTATSDPYWQIKKTDTSTGRTVFAQNDDAFKFVWDNRTDVSLWP